MGSTTIRDGFVVATFEPPPIDLRYPTDLTLDETQLTSIRRRGITVENAGEIIEMVRIGEPGGDIDLFSLIDEDGREVQELTAEVAPGETAVFFVQFEPIGLSQNGVSFELSARDGDFTDTVVVRGRGLQPELLLVPDSPQDFGTLAAMQDVDLPRIDLLLPPAALPRQTIIEDVRIELFVNNQPTDATENFTWELNRTAGSDDDPFYWGESELQWSVNGPFGSYRGRLLFETDSPSAPLVNLSFSFIVGNDTGGDDPVDAGDGHRRR